MSQERPLILIADDEPGNVMLLEKYLVPLDYRIITTTNGRQAIEQARAHHPDLILLDIMMPETDGYEVCRVIKSDESLADIIVIFITAKANLEDRVEGLELGGHDYIVKPFHLPELRARIQAALRVKELQDKLKERNDQLKDLSITDELTGLRNKRYLLERLKEEVSRAMRYGSALSCLILDIDHFKQVNDRYGHPTGDRVLRDLAQTIRRSLRSVDIAARYGGEEFVLLLPQTPESGATAVAERIRRTIADRELSELDPPMRLTVSIGVAAISDSQGASADQLIERADRALYLAKEAGRNRVAFTAGPTAPTDSHSGS